MKGGERDFDILTCKRWTESEKLIGGNLLYMNRCCLQFIGQIICGMKNTWLAADKPQQRDKLVSAGKL